MGSECGVVRKEKNRGRVLSGQDVPSKNHGAGAPRDLGRVGARGGSARAQREEEGAPSLACVRSNATRDSRKLGLMPFEIAWPGHRISEASQECGAGILARGSAMYAVVGQPVWYH